MIDKDVLKKLYIEQDKTQEEISEILNVPDSTVSYYVVKYNLKKTRPWTQEEIEYLEDKYGAISLTTIAKNLNRSISSVNTKKTKLKLGSVYNATEYLTIPQLAEIVGVDRTTVADWIKNKYLNATKRVLHTKGKYWRIKTSDFWKFVKEYPKFIDFSKFEENSLGKEPAWVKNVRKNANPRPRNSAKPWTKTQEALLKKYWNEGKTNKEIGDLLGRTPYAVRFHAIKKLGLKPKQISLIWQPIEIKMLTDMYQKGYTDEEIAKELGRGRRSINWKRQELGLTKATKNPDQSILSSKTENILKNSTSLYHMEGGNQVAN